jgi:CelD/BcsL family acetyltransferase involved in cellulose biosynthesis
VDPPQGYRIAAVADATALACHVAAWDDLAANAIEPNPFYESWMLLPAMEHLAADQAERVVVVLVYLLEAPGPPRLIGLFPFARRKRYRGLPFSHLTLWDYGACYLSTPLLRRGYGRAALAALWEWLHDPENAGGAMELHWVPAEGPIAQLLTDFCNDLVPVHFQSRQFTRAMLLPCSSADEYLQRALSPGRRRALARKERRLRAGGDLQIEELGPEGDLDAWVEEFLRLESSGWKGRAGTALASNPAMERFFRSMARAGHTRGRLWLSALRLDGRAVAMRCNLIASPGAFFFKPAYDESFARCSPGVLLELDTIRRLHARPDVAWMDSCTASTNGLLNTLWLDRRIIQTTVWATSKGRGGLLLSAQMLLRWLKADRASPLPERAPRR